jgi:hypothetical protein
MTMDQLRQEATAKGLSVAELAAMLLETIVLDDLYEAVLGEQEDVACTTPTISKPRMR